jgi:hypothetical protein
VKPVYGLNQAPRDWLETLHRELISSGYQQSLHDKCLYILRDGAGRMVSMIVSHVDDVLAAGTGKLHWDAMTKLRTRFQFGKWSDRWGKYLGAVVEQHEDWSVTIQMADYPKEKLEAIKLPKNARNEDFVSPQVVAAMRKQNGGLSWLSKQLRIDLCVQTSLSQQSMPRPTIADAKRTNNAIRRAKQYPDLAIRLVPVPLDRLAFLVHADASLKNATQKGTQAGWLLSICDKDVLEGKEQAWGPIGWKSGRLRRVVQSTLSAEMLSLQNAAREAEWAMSMTAEILYKDYSVETRADVLPHLFTSALATDAKSVFDYLVSATPSNAKDREVALDGIVVEQIRSRIGARVRWLPGSLQLADILTKDMGDAAMYFRNVLAKSTYCLGDEEKAMATRKEIREEKKPPHPVKDTTRKVEVQKEEKDMGPLKVEDYINEEDSSDSDTSSELDRNDESEEEEEVRA